MTTVHKSADQTEEYSSVWERMNQFSDRWSPLLVREIRRMSKSRSFAVTFIGLMLLSLLFCYFNILSRGNGIAYAEVGDEICFSFLSLLTLPVLLVVPISTYSSISQEHSENTLETLSITTLKTEDILYGYLLCGYAHMLVYFSAVVPFIAFSYLLDGLGLVQLVYALLTVAFFGLVALLWGMMLGCCAKGSISRGVCSTFTVLGSLLLVSICNGSVGLIFAANEVFSTLGGMACALFILLPCMVIFYGIARQQIQLTDPLTKPYRVVLDDSGKVIKFIPRYSSVYVEIPEWYQQEMNIKMGNFNETISESSKPVTS